MINCRKVTSEDIKLANLINKKIGSTMYDGQRVANMISLFEDVEGFSFDKKIQYFKSKEQYKGKDDEATVAAFNSIMQVISNKHSLASNHIIDNLSSKIRDLKTSIPDVNERTDRVNMISDIFSNVVTALRIKNPNLSRVEIIKGVKTENGIFGGQSVIFSQVYKYLSNLRNKAAEAYQKDGNENAGKYYNNINTMLSNFDILVLLAKNKIKQTEKVALSAVYNYAHYVDENSNIEDLREDEIAEETILEHWQEDNDTKSPFSRVSSEIRYMLGGIKQVDESGNVIRDTLGNPKKMDSVESMQTLLNILHKCSSEHAMMSKLEHYSQEYPWLNQIIQRVTKDNELRTKLFNSTRFNKQYYTKTREKSRRGNFITYVDRLNKPVNILNKEYMSSLRSGKINDNSSIFTKEGKINNHNLSDLIKTFVKGIDIVGDENNKTVAYTLMTRSEKKDFLSKIFKGLNLPYSPSIIKEIISNNNKAIRLLDKIDDFISDGILYKYTKNDINKLLTGNNKDIQSVDSKKVSDIISYKNSNGYNVFEAIASKVTDSLLDFKPQTKYESVIYHKDASGKTIRLSSYVNPSYLGDFVSTVQSFVEDGDSEGLKNYIESKYGDIEYLAYKDKNGETHYKNIWLEELAYGGVGANSVASSLSYERYLGDEATDFKNLSKVGDLKSIMLSFFAKIDDVNTEDGSRIAHFPVFILGDSGVSKFITGKAYNKDRATNLMYRVYRQEVTAESVSEGVVSHLRDVVRSNGLSDVDYKDFYDEFSSVKNYSKSFDKFHYLTFLNPDEFKELAEDLGVTDIKSMTLNQFTTLYEKYMEKSIEDFKNSLLKADIISLNDDGTLNSKLLEPHLNKSVEDSIEEFMYNYKLAIIQQLQIMTIDPAFYKDVKDLQKRYKEIHSPGSKLSLDAMDENGELYLPVDKDGNTKPQNVIYFKDIELDTSKHDRDFTEVVHKTHQYVPDDYSKSSLTDGQGYRTIEGARRILGAAGMWTPEMKRAYNRLQEIRESMKNENRTELLNEERAELVELKNVFPSIKPYTYTLEKVTGDNGTLAIPTQHKYSELILIPELLPKGSKLRDIAEYMDNRTDKDGNADPIDLVLATSCVKVGSFGATHLDNLNQWDKHISKNENKNITNKDRLNTALDMGYVHKLDYGDYRIQSTVEAHPDEMRAEGTQLRKIPISNISFDKDYSTYIGGNEIVLSRGSKAVKLNGRNLIKLYNQLHALNIMEDGLNLVDKVGDPAVMSEMLIHNVLSNDRERIDNINAYSLKDGKFNMPLFEYGIEHDVSAYIFSLFRKQVSNQLMSGGSLVQASSMGISDYSEGGDLKIIRKNDNIVSAECEVPFALSYLDPSGKKVELKFEDWCNPDGTPKLNSQGNTLLEEKFPGILNILGYRIPTERNYSIINLKIKRFSTNDSTIKVPLQWTTVAGFDFDIDKLYFIKKEFRGKSGSGLHDIIFDEYDTNLSPAENSRTARNNMILNILLNRLADPETLKDRTIPGGFDTASYAARYMRELLFGPSENVNKYDIMDNILYLKDPEPEYDITDPMTRIIYNAQNQVAGKLIGIFANQNSNHAFTSLFSSLSLKEDISFLGKSVSDLIEIRHIKEVDTNMAEFLAASVDAVKDPVLNFLNLSPITANAGALLVRLGYPMIDVGILFNQPIIKELCETSNIEGKPIDYLISKVLSDNERVFSTDSEGFDNIEDITEDDMMFNIFTYRHYLERNPTGNINNIMMLDKVFAKNQLRILSFFSNVLAVANDLSKLITTSKFSASNFAKSNYGDNLSQVQRVKSFEKQIMDDSLSFDYAVNDNDDNYIPERIVPYLNTVSDYIESNSSNPMLYEHLMYASFDWLINDAMSKYFPYSGTQYAGMLDHILGISSSRTSIDGNTINDILSSITEYKLSNYGDKSVNPFSGYSLIEESRPAYYNGYVVKSEKKDNISEEDMPSDMIYMSISKDSVKEAIKEGVLKINNSVKAYYSDPIKAASEGNLIIGIPASQREYWTVSDRYGNTVTDATDLSSNYENGAEVTIYSDNNGYAEGINLDGVQIYSYNTVDGNVQSFNHFINVKYERLDERTEFSKFEEETFDDPNYIYVTYKPLDFKPKGKVIQIPTSPNRNLTLSTSSLDGYQGSLSESSELSNVTIDFSRDFSTQESLFTRQIAGNRYIQSKIYDIHNKDVARRASSAIYEELVKRGMENSLVPITLHISGNGIYSFDDNVSQSDIDSYVLTVLTSLKSRGVNIGKVVSSGQTGADEAGIKAALALGIDSEIIASKEYVMTNKYGKSNNSVSDYIERFIGHTLSSFDALSSYENALKSKFNLLGNEDVNLKVLSYNGNPAFGFNALTVNGKTVRVNVVTDAKTRQQSIKVGILGGKNITKEDFKTTEEAVKYNKLIKAINKGGNIYSFLKDVFNCDESIGDGIIKLMNTDKTVGKNAVYQVISDNIMETLIESVREGKKVKIVGPEEAAISIKNYIDYVVNKDKNIISNKEYYSKHFAASLKEFIESPSKDTREAAIKNNLLIKSLDIVEDARNDNEFIIKLNSARATGNQRQAISEAWEQLLKLDKKLAIDLFMYGFYKNGLSFEATSLLNEAPYEVKKSIMLSPTKSYIDVLNDILENQDNEIDEQYRKEFTLLFLRNNMNNSSIVQPLYKDTADGIAAFNNLNSARSISNSFTVDLSYTDTTLASKFIKNYDADSKMITIVGAVKVNGKLFVSEYLLNDNINFNDTDGIVLNAEKASNVTYVEMPVKDGGKKMLYNEFVDTKSLMKLLNSRRNFKEDTGNHTDDTGKKIC